MAASWQRWRHVRRKLRDLAYRWLRQSGAFCFFWLSGAGIWMGLWVCGAIYKRSPFWSLLRHPMGLSWLAAVLKYNSDGYKLHGVQFLWEADSRLVKKKSGLLRSPKFHFCLSQRFILTPSFLKNHFNIVFSKIRQGLPSGFLLS